jgi:hypothetical protein
MREHTSFWRLLAVTRKRLLSQELAAAAEASGTMLDPAADARANELAAQTRLILGITRR